MLFFRHTKQTSKNVADTTFKEVNSTSVRQTVEGTTGFKELKGSLIVNTYTLIEIIPKLHFRNAAKSFCN